MIIRSVLLLLLSTDAGVDLPRIGCWRQSAEAGPSRELFGIAGNLVVREVGEEGCPNDAEWTVPDDEGVRTLRLNDRWRLAVSTTGGERYLLYRGSQRYELPQ